MSEGSTTTEAATSRGFTHDALFYSDEASFLEGLLPFLRQGAESGNPTLVVLRRHQIDLLEKELGDTAEAIEWAAMEEVGLNPARIIPAWVEFVEHRGGYSHPVRGVGEPIWSDRGKDELVECVHHESLLNLAFADNPTFWLRCPYDTQALDDDLLEAARRNHPMLAVGDRVWASESYVAPGVGPDAAPSPFTGILPEPDGAVDTIEFDIGDLGTVRNLVARRAAPRLNGRVDDLVIAVNELAANSVLHGGGRGRLRIWWDGGAIFCEVQDEGTIGDDMRQLLLGRVKPTLGQNSGRGIWLVNQLCDLVQIRSNYDGTTVRVRMNA